MGKKVGEGEDLFLALAVEADDLDIRGKLPQYLTADSTGDAEVPAPARHRDADEVGVALADGQKFSLDIPENRVEALGLTEGCTCRRADLHP